MEDCFGLFLLGFEYFMASQAQENAVITTHQTEIAAPVPFGVRLRAHIAIMRLDHSIKNIFLLPGIVVALSLMHPNLSQLSQIRLTPIVIGVIAVTLIACSNYVLNELLDAPYDRLHPHKCNRPAALGLIEPGAAYL